MTPEQLDEIEKLAEDGAFKVAGYYALPLVKALREAREERDAARVERDAAMRIVREASDFLDVPNHHLVAEARTMSIVAKMWSETCEIGQKYLRDEVDVGTNIFSAIPKVVRQRDEARAEVERLREALGVKP